MEYREKMKIARGPKTSWRSLIELSKDESSKVRRAVAENPATPAHVLERLSADGNGQVRREVAKHPNTLESTLSVLSRDPEWDIRLEVVYHPSTPTHVLGKMVLMDKDPYIRSYASEKLTERGVVTPVTGVLIFPLV